MRRFLLIIPLLFQGLYAEGLSTGSVTDPGKTPYFGSCSDIADIKKNKPILLSTYSQVLPNSSEPAYFVKGPVEIDIKTGTVGYKVYSSTTGDIIEKPTYSNKQCIQIDENAINKEIDGETLSVREEVQRMYDSADTIYNQAQADSEQKSEGATQADVLGQALSGNVEAAQKSEKKVAKYNVQNSGSSRSSMTSPHLGFMARINAVSNEVQTFLFLGIVFITFVGMGGGFLSKKIQDKTDHEDYIARFGLGLFLTFMLFAPSSTYKYGKSEISQTRMQEVWGWMLNKGTGWGNVLAGAAHYEQMRTTIDQTGGKEITSQISKAVRERAELENKQGAYEAILHQCIQSYKVSDLAMAIGSEKGGGKRYFPTDESTVKFGEEDVYSRYLMPEVNQNDVFMSLSSCGKAEEEYRVLVAQKKSLQEKIEAGKNTKMQVRYTQSAKQIIGDTTSAGWIGIAMLPVHHFIAQGVGSKIHEKIHPIKDKEDQKIKDCKDISWGLDFDRISCEVERIDEFIDPFHLVETVKTLSFDGMVESLSQRSLLLMVPGTVPLKETISGIFKGSSIPTMETFGQVIGFMIATDVGLTVINNLPFLVLIPAISIVIALYYAEVFLYSVTIPFVAAYAFSRDQWGHLVKHAVRGIMIALKPAMIVISVYAAIYVSDKVSTISANMIAKQTAILLSNAEKEKPTQDFFEAIKDSLSKLKPIAADTSYVSGLNHDGGVGILDMGVNYLSGKVTIYIISGLLAIIMAIVQVFIVVKIIVSGPAMIMEMFGVRETDMASQMTDSIVSRGQKFEGGI